MHQSGWMATTRFPSHFVKVFDRAVQHLLCCSRCLWTGWMAFCSLMSCRGFLALSSAVCGLLAC